MQEIRLKLGFKLRLTDLLIKPIQRLTKYHMLLEAILKHSHRAGLTEEAAAIEQAFHVMTIVPNQANDMMDIGRLQGFEVSQLETQFDILYNPLSQFPPIILLFSFSLVGCTVYLLTLNVAGQDRGSGQVVAARAATLYGRPRQRPELQAEGDDRLSVRADHDLRNDGGQENPVHQPCLHLQSSHTGKGPLQ